MTAKALSLLTFCFIGALETLSQDSIDFNKAPNTHSKLIKVVVAEATLYAGSMITLNSMWYKNYPKSKFHFFNDNHEWLQMDKIGHSTTAYHTGRLGYELFKYAGLNEKQATWAGGSLGFIYLTNIEILDGFSEQWGASPGDLAANTLGSALFISQQLAWREQRVVIKYSFHQSPYPKYNPDLLGKNAGEQFIKDYNGHTYWLSANISSFLTAKQGIPKWLNIAVGYSASGMTTAIAKSNNNVAQFNRYRQYYLSPDIDFTRIKTNSAFLKKVFFTLNVFKLPAPALELSKQHFKFYWLYF